MMEIRLQVGEKAAYVDGQAISLPEAPLLVGGTLMVPVRALAEALGMTVTWDPATQSATLLAELPAAAAMQAPVRKEIPDWHKVADPTGNPGAIWKAPITSTEADRDPQLLEAVIRQCGVKTAPRYRMNQQGLGETYCNIFLWDVTLALGCEIPHWVDAGTRKQPVLVGQGVEQNANQNCQWLAQYGAEFGWTRADAATALAYANQGRPAVAVWENPGGIGHVAVVCPGQADPVRGVPIAQAGVENFDDRFLADGFGQSRIDLVTYYVHA